jgi:hypothetical protein
MADIERIMALARRHDLRVIEDCAHMHGGNGTAEASGALEMSAPSASSTPRPWRVAKAASASRTTLPLPLDRRNRPVLTDFCNGLGVGHG